MRDDRLLVVVIGGERGRQEHLWGHVHRKELPVNFYNADSIAQGLGSYNDPTLQLEARQAEQPRDFRPST